ncbi:MAG: transporter substrate-binding domain-containing protein [Clostridia bacterium]|nr:transporter substrate-binding domain-containing protein [Clostridia bacterium]MBQ8743488.1 transporter substrate-binding domain-containing protein [Clostridia bacterium]
MKKILALILAAVMLTLTFTSCAGSKTKIGVQSGTTGEFYVKGNADMELPGYSNIECKAFDNGGLAVKALLDGQIDYVVIDNEPAKQLLAKNPDDIKIIDIALTTEQYAYGVDKNQPELLEDVNEIIAEIKENGTLKAIFDKYAALEYDDEGNVIGGDEAIEGIASASKNASKAAQQLVVSTNAAFAPYEYKKGDKFVGIDMEIAKLIADELGLELVIEDMAFESVVTSVGKNNVDIAMAGLSVTATRKQSVNFSDAYYEGAYQVLIVKKDNTEFDKCTTKEDVEKILKTK